MSTPDQRDPMTPIATVLVVLAEQTRDVFRDVVSAESCRGSSESD